MAGDETVLMAFLAINLGSAPQLKLRRSIRNPQKVKQVSGISNP
jgi:hypothetical protein